MIDFLVNLLSWFQIFSCVTKWKGDYIFLGYFLKYEMCWHYETSTFSVGGYDGDICVFCMYTKMLFTISTLVYVMLCDDMVWMWCLMW